MVACKINANRNKYVTCDWLYPRLILVPPGNDLLVLAMSFNASAYGPLPGFVGDAYDQLAAMSTPRLVLFLLINIPLISIAFNVLYQLVRL